MKEKRNFLIGIFLSGIVGWTLGFLRLPYLNKNFSFLLGFITCLAIVGLTFIFISIWKKNALLHNLLSKNDHPQNAKSTFSFVWFLVSGIIVLGGLMSSFFIYQQHQFSKVQIQNQNKKLAQQSELIVAAKKSNAIVIVNNLLDKIDDELKNKSQRTLSENTIERIAALNFSFEPYSYWEGDTLSKRKWSPERGQLLLGLSKMKIDSISFQKIKSITSFLGADLQGANLKNADLNGVDLRNANLTDADLSGANLNEANLRKAVLLRCNLEKLKLKNANLEYVDLRWAEMNGANLEGINLYTANLANAKLRGVDLRKSNLEWADLRGAFLNKSDLTEANLTGANMGKANLTEADLTKVNLKFADLNGLNLTKTTLLEVGLFNAGVVEENWFEKLTEWQVIGAKELQETHKTQVDISNTYNFVIKKIE